MFRGQHQHSIDAKGRTSVPVRFRESLTADHGPSATLIVTKAMPDAAKIPSLWVYPFAEWMRLEAWVSAQNRFDPRVMKLKDVFFSCASEVTLDALGRVLVPPDLRRWAGLEKDVVWTGKVDHMGLWSLANFERMDAQRESEEVLGLVRELGELRG